jgi:O-antigen ligase
MKRKIFFIGLAVLIFISPWPFGSIGDIWQPLFYFLVLVLSLLGLVQCENQETKNKEYRILKILIGLFFLFSVFQIIPFPDFIIKWLSPASQNILQVFAPARTLQTISLLPIESISFIFRFFTLTVLVYILMNMNMKNTEMMLLLKTIVFSGFFQIIFALLKLIFNNKYFFLFFYQDAEPYTNLTGTIANPDHFSFYLEIIFPVVLGFLILNLVQYKRSIIKHPLISLNRTQLRLYLFTALLYIMGIILTRSRIGLFILVQISVLLFIVFIHLLKNEIHLKSIKLTFIIFFIVMIALSTQVTLSKFLHSDSFNNIRSHFWKNALELHKDFPLLGSGLGCFKYTFLLYDKDAVGWVTHNHNEYIEFLSEAGLIGSFLFFGIFVYLFCLLIIKWLKLKELQSKLIGISVISCLVVAAVHSIFDFSLRIPANSFLLAILIAIGLRITSAKSVNGKAIYE